MKNPLPTILVVSVLIVLIAVVAGLQSGPGGVVVGLIVAFLSTVVIGGVISNHISRKRQVDMDRVMRQTKEGFVKDREAFRGMKKGPVKGRFGSDRIH